MQDGLTRPHPNPGLRAFLRIARAEGKGPSAAVRTMNTRPRAPRTAAMLKAYLRIERGYSA
jgi:hypothetical protein